MEAGSPSPTILAPAEPVAKREIRTDLTSLTPAVGDDQDMSDHSFDVIVIGAGPSGEVAAGRLGERGLSVALVEDRLVGGECSYWGCMPSKALIRPGQALAEVRRLPGAAEAVSGPLDAAAALARRDEVIHHLDDAVQLPWIEERGVRLFRGSGVLTGVREVTVGDDVLTAVRAVILATGTTPSMPPIPGLAEATAWSNREITTAEAVPRRLAVIGGGAIGVEMAGAWRSLGSEVTLMEVAPRILAREEEFASAQVADGLRADGVTVHEGVGIERVERVGSGGEVTVVLDSGTRVVADELLVAAGRKPQTEGIGIELVGGAPGRPLAVDDSLRVPGHEWLFVTGDANGRALLTHMGKHQARIAADVITGADARLRASADPPPRVTFSDPQVAAVGHTLVSAREAGLTVRAVDVETSGNAGGSFYGRGVPGTSRLVVDEDRRVVVGATFVGAEVQDFLHAATIAVVGAVPLDDLWHAVPAFPTRSEVWLNLLQEYGL
jgi:pyruvate/2-oxoglutarate dehydrogenase complex dihydrolipoamide dehydrogenase (E3) component